jgi:hypothetical protein
MILIKGFRHFIIIFVFDRQYQVYCDKNWSFNSDRTNYEEGFR